MPIRRKWLWLMLLGSGLALVGTNVVHGLAWDREQKARQTEIAEKQAEMLDLSGLYEAVLADRDQVRLIARRELSAAVAAADAAESRLELALELQTGEVDIPVEPAENPWLDALTDCELRLVSSYALAAATDSAVAAVPPARLPPIDTAAGVLKLSADVHALVTSDELGRFYLSGTVFGRLRNLGGPMVLPSGFEWSGVLPLEKTEAAVDQALQDALRAARAPSPRHSRELFAGLTTEPGAFLGYSGGRRRIGYVVQALYGFDSSSSSSTTSCDRYDSDCSTTAVSTSGKGLEFGAGLRYRFGGK